MAGVTGLVQRFFPTWPKVGANTFILWEPCSKSHGEVVPGYTQYLLDLGYDVLVLMTPARLDEGLFCRMTDSRITHGGLSQRQIRRFVRGPAVHDAAGILVSTAGKLPERSDGTYDLERVFGQVPQRCLLVEHNAKAQIDAGVWSDKTVTLRALEYQGAQSIVVNPHVFGDVKISPKNTDTTVFLMIGAARSKRGNQPLVYESALKLLEAGVTNFQIRVIGKPGKIAVPGPLQPYVTILGRLSFAQMYQEVETADFILTSFQKDSPEHAFYRTTGTSGSFQLSYGFAKPLIVQRRFGALAGFGADNALTYDEDAEMATAMTEAVRMDGAAYSQVQNALRATAQGVYDHSLANLKVLIDG